MKYLLIIILTITISNNIYCQQVTQEKTIKYINTKLKDICVFELINGKLIIQFYQNNEIYRQDKINIYGIDYNKIYYSNDEKAIILRCFEDDDECVTRHIYKNNIKKHFSRSNILVESIDSTNINRLTKAINFLVKSSQEPDYKLYEFFE